MTYSLYIIQSEKDGSYDIGTTRDLDDRILRHNKGRSKYTRQKRSWKLTSSEEYPNRSIAMKREYAIKRRKSKTALKN